MMVLMTSPKHVDRLLLELPDGCDAISVTDLEHGIMQAGVFKDDHRGLGYPNRYPPQVQGLAGKHQLALRQQGP